MQRHGKKFITMTNRPKSLITGAGFGIGREIAEKFANEGHDLFLHIRKKSEYKSLKNLEKKYNVKIQIIIGDL